MIASSQEAFFKWPLIDFAHGLAHYDELNCVWNNSNAADTLATTNSAQ